MSVVGFTGSSMMASNPLRKIFSSRASDSLVAVEASPTGLSAIHVRRDGAGLLLDGFRSIEIAAGANALEAALREALDLRIDAEPVAFSITSPEVAIRSVEMPPMTPDELRQALPWEARRHIAGISDETVVGAQVLGGDAGSPMEVVIVAVPRARYAEIEEACARLRTESAFIDVSPLSAMNSVVAGEAADALVALLDLGPAAGAFSIFSKSSLLLFRDLSPRVTRLDSLLAAALSLSQAEARSFKLTGKLPTGETPPRGVVDKAIAEVVGELVDDLQSGIISVENRTGRTIDRALLVGGSTPFFDRHGITEAIAAQSGTTLERHDPLRRFRIGLVDEIGLRARSSELAAVAGLAARFFQA